MLKKALTIAGIVIGIWLLNLFAGFFAVNFAAAKHQTAAHIIEGIARAGEVKSRINQFFQTSDRFPDSNRELGIGEPETYRHGTVDKATVGPLGQIRIDYAGSGLDEATIVMRPEANISGTGPAIRWECFALGVDESVTALIHEPRCVTLDAQAAIPALPEPAATVDNLINAIHARRASLVRHWIAAGVNVDSPGRNGEFPLTAAISAGDSAILQLLLEAGADANRRPQDHGPTPLMQAASSRCSPNLMQLLLDAGAEIEARDGQGKTALLYAAKSGDVNCVSVLLRAGANADATDNSGNQAINYAASYSRSSGAYTALRNHELRQQRGEEFVYRLPQAE